MEASVWIDNFTPHALRLGFVENDERRAKDIEEELLPRPRYYKEIREALNNQMASEFDIERSILRKWDRADIGKLGKYGEPWRNHVARFMKILMPKTVVTPSFMDELYAIELAIACRLEVCNLIGHKSAGKSALLARLALTLICVDPDYSVAYAAAPYKNVAGYTIWSEVESCFREIEEEHKRIFPHLQSKKSESTFQISAGHAKAGFIRLIGLDQVSKFQGTKQREQSRGFFILLADEIGVFPSQAFIEIIGNVTVNAGFLGITGCNFKNTLGMEGTLCEPLKGEYTNLSLEGDHIWLSAYKSVTLRLDGHLCPNVLAKRTIYPFLLTEEKRANLEEIHGLRGPKYLEQARSFPNNSSGDRFVLTLDQIRAGGAYDKFWQPVTSDVWQRVSFCDPGWGGDPCKWGAFEFGRAMVQTHDGSMKSTMLLKPVGPIQTIRVQEGLLVTEEVLAKFSRFSRGPVMVKEGRELSMDMQIALACAELNASHNIPSSNFGFDSSMRGGIVQEMVTILGPEIVSYDTGSKPTTMSVGAQGGTAQDKYRNLRSEMFFNLASIITSGQFRDADKIQDALGQVCRHKVVQAGMKDAVEGKDKFKESNQGKSPDACDVACGGFHMARRRGFEMAVNKREAANHFHENISTGIPIRPRPTSARLRS